MDDITFDSEGQKLSFSAPEYYLSKTSDKKERIYVLENGIEAPDFSLMDMEGNLVNLKDYRGKKVFLDFFMINCGWCKHALDKFNKPEFEFKEDIVPLYINPVDKKERMERYLEKTTVGFPVLIDAKETGLAYGVTGYPTFFILDERGKIEKSFVGFREEMMEMVKK